MCCWHAQNVEKGVTVESHLSCQLSDIFPRNVMYNFVFVVEDLVHQCNLPTVRFLQPPHFCIGSRSSVSCKRPAIAIAISCTRTNKMAIAAVDVIGGLTYPVTFWLYASQIPLCWQMSREGYGSSEKYSFMPTLATLLNCLLWASYGLLNGKGGSVLGVNSGGVLFCLLYAVCFLLYAPGVRGRVHLLSQLATAASILILVDLPLFVLRPARAVTILGCICVAVNIILFASPVLSIAHAVSARDVSRVPVMLTCANLVCGCLWTSLGVLSGDLFVSIPNLVGIFLTLAQLAVILYVRTLPPSMAHSSAASTSQKQGGTHGQPIAMPMPGDSLLNTATATHAATSGRNRTGGKAEVDMLEEALFHGEDRCSPPPSDSRKHAEHGQSDTSRRTSASSMSLQPEEGSGEEEQARAAEEGRAGAYASSPTGGTKPSEAGAGSGGSSQHLRQRSVAPVYLPPERSPSHKRTRSGLSVSSIHHSVLARSPGMPLSRPTVTVGGTALTGPASLRRQYTEGASSGGGSGGLKLTIAGMDTGLGSSYAHFKTAQPGSFVGYSAAGVGRSGSDAVETSGSAGTVREYNDRDHDVGAGDDEEVVDLGGYAPTTLDWDVLGASSSSIYARTH